MSSQKHICFALVLLCLFFATSLHAQAPAAAVPAPDTGRVEGSKYTNTYFGFTYRIPEGWAVRTTSGKMPGGVGGNLLLMLKRRSGDALSSIFISATELSPDYRNDVSRFLVDRYRLNQGVTSGLTINGRTVGRKTRYAEPELITVAEHTYHRLDFDSASVSRTVLATVDKGYAIVFEIVTPEKDGDQAGRELIDSMYAVTFASPEPVQRTDKR